MQNQRFKLIFCPVFPSGRCCKQWPFSLYTHLFCRRQSYKCSFQKWKIQFLTSVSQFFRARIWLHVTSQNLGMFKASEFSEHVFWVSVPPPAKQHWNTLYNLHHPLLLFLARWSLILKARESRKGAQEAQKESKQRRNSLMQLHGTNVF